MKRLALAVVLVAAFGLAAAAEVVFEAVGVIPVHAESVEVQDGLAFVAAGKTLSIYDVRNPAAPKALGAYAFPEEIWAFRLQGQTAYVGVNFFGLGILDVSNPSAPILRGSFKTPGQAKNGAVFGTRALVIDHMEGVVEVNLADPSKPTSPGSFFVDGYARDVVTSGPLAIAVDSPTGLYVFDLARPGPLEPIAAVQTGTSLRTIEVMPGDGPPMVVAVGGGALQTYDLSNPAAPIRVAPFRTPGGAQRVAFRDRMAYVADGPAGLTVVDLTNPAAPTIVGSYKTPTNARDVAVEAGLVLIAVANGDVMVLREQ